MGFLIFVVSLASVLAFEAAAFPLAHYRAQMKSTATMDAAAKARVATLRKYLQTTGVKFTAANDANGPFRKWEAGSDNGRKDVSSALFKMLMGKAAKELKRVELYDKPPMFDPTRTLAELPGDREKRRRAFCDKQFEITEKNHPNYADIVDEYVAYLGRRTAFQAAPSTPVATRFEEARRAALVEHLKTAPAKAPEPGIEARFGKLESVQWIEGQLAVMRFVKRDEKGQESEALPLTLSMLSTIRSGDDEYFLAMLRCFAGYVNDRLATRIAGPETKEKLEFIGGDVQDKVTAAGLVHDLITRLSVPQQNFLIDVFLQANGTEVPADDEMSSEDLQGWNPLTVPSFPTYVENYVAKNKLVPGEIPNIGVMLRDERFYRLQHEQLYRLADALHEEAQTKAKVDEVIDDLQRRKR